MDPYIKLPQFVRYFDNLMGSWQNLVFDNAIGTWYDTVLIRLE
jgi:hypothetical protein